MRKLIVFASIVVILTAVWIFYLHQENKNFIDTLPTNNSSTSAKSANEMEDANDFVKVAVDGERFSPDDRVHETLPQEQTAAEEETPSETPTPDQKADFVRDQWIQMFGDIPQVHAAAEYMRIIYKDERMTLDKEIAGLEALHHLYPDGGHGILLEMRKRAKARGLPVTYLTEEDRKNLRYAENIKRIVIGEPPPHLRGKNAQMGNVPTSDRIASGGMGEDTVSPAARSELPVTSEHVHQAGRHVHETPASQPPVPPAAANNVESSSWEELLPEQRAQAKQLCDEYGTAEGLRRLREMDPDAAKRFERE